MDGAAIGDALKTYTIKWLPDSVEILKHSSLTKAEKKELCGLMDVKKLTTDASMHAAQNERLPMRVIVHVLFFEQVRAAANIDEESEKTTTEDCSSVEKQMSAVKIEEDGLQKNGKLAKKNIKNSRLPNRFIQGDGGGSRFRLPLLGESPNL